MLVKSVIWNLAGGVAPAASAIVAIPLLIHGLGIDRYGILSLVTLLVGYLGAFELGLSRAATRYIADALGGGQVQDVPQLFWTSLLLTAIFGSAAAIATSLIGYWIVDQFLKVPYALHRETVLAFGVLAISIPFLTMGATLSALLSAYQRFDFLNLIKIPLGVFATIGPLAAIPFTHNLAYIAAVLLVGRAAACIAFLALCLHAEPRLRVVAVNFGSVRPLLRFGAWTTVNYVVAPLMTYADRFIIGSIISIAAVTYYTIPFQITTKLFILSGALTGVLFPAFSAAVTTSPERATRLLERGTLILFIVLFPISLMLVMFGREGLTLWVGRDLANHSETALRWLAIGVFVNAFVSFPSGMIQAANRPDITSKMLMLEAPVYFVVLWWMLREYGISGAAATWALRLSIEAIIIYGLMGMVVPESRSGVRKILALVGSGTMVLALGFLPLDFAIRAIIAGALLLLFAISCWAFLLEYEDEEFISGYWRSLVAIVAPAQEP